MEGVAQEEAEERNELGGVSSLEKKKMRFSFGSKFGK